MTIKDIITPQSAVCSYDDRRKVVVEEKGRKYEGTNASFSKWLVIHVDKGLIIATDCNKCDYAIIRGPKITDLKNEFTEDFCQKQLSECICFLIELKGADISHACKQIEASINYFQQLYGIKKFVGRIVCSKCKTLKLTSNEKKNLQQKLDKLKKQYGIQYDSLKISTNILSEDI